MKNMYLVEKYATGIYRLLYPLRGTLDLMLISYAFLRPYAMTQHTENYAFSRQMHHLDQGAEPGYLKRWRRSSI